MQLSCFLGFLFVITFPQISLVIDNRDDYKEYWPGTSYNVHQFGFTRCFSHGQARFTGLWSLKTTKGKYHSHHSLSRVHTFKTNVDTNLDQPAEIRLSHFNPSTSPHLLCMPLPFLYCMLCKGVTKHWPKLRGRKQGSSPP